MQNQNARSIIFREALAATARVACAAALVGCARTPLPSPGALDTAAVDTAQDTRPADTGDTTVDTGTDTGETGTDTGADTGTDTGLGECTAESLTAQVQAGQAGEEILGCCQTLAVDWDFVNADSETRLACCELLDWDAQSFPGCTPWGPPRPPSMGQRLMAAREVRAVRAAALAGVV